MDKREFVKRLYAGIFLIIGIALIVVVILAIGMEKGLTQPKFQISVVFREVGGLSIGAPVRLSGVNVGTVGSIDFLENKFQGRGVIVNLLVFTRYRKQLEKAKRFMIKTEGVLGEKIVKISSSQYGEQIDFTQPIIGEDPLDVQDLAEKFGDTAKSLTATSEGIRKIVFELREIGRTSKRLLDRIERRLIEGNLFRVF